MNAIAANPAFFGFNNLFQKMEGILQRTKSYPPYNVVRRGKDIYGLEMGLAGYSKEDITVEIDQTVLTIVGKRYACVSVGALMALPHQRAHNEDEDIVGHDKVGPIYRQDYLHNGICQQAFSRSFTLPDYMTVTDCQFFNGLLAINMVKTTPKEFRPTKIEINDRPELPEFIDF